MHGNRNNKPIGIVLSVAFLLAVASLATPALAAGDTDLAGRVAGWEKMFNAGDVDGIAAMYTEDATRMPYELPLITGRKAIAANITEARAQGATSVKLAAKKDEASGDMAWGHGTFQLIDADGNTILAGKWMNVSKKVGGKWLIHADIWNTDEPAE